MHPISDPKVLSRFFGSKEEVQGVSPNFQDGPQQVLVEKFLKEAPNSEFGLSLRDIADNSNSSSC